MKNILTFLIISLTIFSCNKNLTPALPPHSTNNLNYYYDRIENGNLQVYTYDGIKETNLVNDNTYDYWWIKVSTDKTKFLCYRSPKNAGINSYTTCELMVFNINGTNGKVIVPHHAYGWEIQAHAKWSPDGKKIMGIAKCKDPSINDLVSRGRIVLFNPDGTNPIIVSKFTHEVADPAWSPDGTKMTYVGPSDLNDETNPEKAEIYQATLNYATMRLENPIRLTYDDKYCYDPSWSPDGKWIAYSKGAFVNLFWTENHDIYKCSPDGTKDTLVLHDGKVNGMPTWTPDGKRLVFHVLGLFEPPPFSLYSCSADGGDKKLILSTNGVKRSTVTAVEK
jgi:TolB protein